MRDKAHAALIQYLKQRGMLKDTVVVWAGEFGRRPMVEIRNPRDADNGGRDHHPLAYSLFLASGGIAGCTHSVSHASANYFERCYNRIRK